MQNTAGFLLVEQRELQPLRVLHCACLFRAATGNPDKVIRPAFREMRQQVSTFGLDPDSLLHVGIPEIVDGQLVSYDCCVEFPLPVKADAVKTLPGGQYIVLTVQKDPKKIAAAIRSLRGDYIPEHGLVEDEDRPIYEIYFTNTLEFCVPIR
jgi:DNA gyrase inhibitor GyrI